MPHMLRIAVESVHDDDGRGVSASRSASQRIVPTASLPPFRPPPATYPVSGRSRQMLRRFLLSGARAARIVRSGTGRSEIVRDGGGEDGRRERIASMRA